MLKRSIDTDQSDRFEDESDRLEGGGTELAGDSVSRKGWFDADTKAFFVSMVVHLGGILALASFTIVTQPEVLQVLIEADPPEIGEREPLDIIEAIAYAESPNSSIGGNSEGGIGIALSAASIVADVSEMPSIPLDIPISRGEFNVSIDIQKAMGITEAPNAVRGLAGVGVTGTDGAVDRITYELLQAIEQRPTLVVWLFDSSVSMVKRRDEIRDRFERIYRELGIVQEAKKKGEPSGGNGTPPLLTSIVSFGERVQFLTKKPTDNLEEIRAAIDEIEIDESGVEMIFTAVKTAANRYKGMRFARDGEPERNVVLITITDERGDDTAAAEEAISTCRKFGIQSHVLGVPAPFGREFTYIRFIDPDPKFDQTPDWRQVDSGPETFLPERVSLGYQDNYFEEPVIDSGFGPYALSRMCYETGGIYFSIHPNRKVGKRIREGEVEAFASRISYFFAPDVMEAYRPDYLPEAEYLSRVKKNPMRAALVQASQMARVGTLERPRLVFVKRDEATFIRDLTRAQQESARLAPELFNLCVILAEGEKHRSKETTPRWLASFDLSYGTALAAKVRAESYNAMLAKAKRGMVFLEPKNNTWNLVPNKSMGGDSKLEKEAKLAKELLQGVVDQHPGTPWALLASNELNHLMGWEWEESFTDLTPNRNNNRGNNNNMMLPNDDQMRMLAPPPPKRPAKKI